MPDDKKGRVKINPKIVAEHKREQKEGYKGTVEEYYEEFYGPIPDGFEKGGMTKSQKKVGTVMKEFKAGKLKSSSGKKVTNPKQAIAIGLSEAGMSKKKMMGGGMMSDGVSKKGMGVEMKSKGGMVRGQGIAIRGTKFKGIF